MSEWVKRFLVDDAISSLEVVAQTLLSGLCGDLQSMAMEQRGQNVSGAVSR